ncbi:hypothetical protein Q5752_001297 [Cryptotrichosporon argae]
MSNPAQDEAASLPRPSGTAVSLPSPTDPAAVRPSSSGRPRTSARPPRTARPDTSASAIGELPDRQFFPDREDDFDEDDEDYTDEEEEEDVFAFQRPQTGAVTGMMSPGTLSSGASDMASAPNTGALPTTGDTAYTGYTTRSGMTFGMSRKSSAATGTGTDALDVPASAPMTFTPSPTGPVDVGGQITERVYDPAHPTPFSGRNNLNNSAFAFSVPSRRNSRRGSHDTTASTGTGQPSRQQSRGMTGGTLGTGRSVFRRARQALTTASTWVSTVPSVDSAASEMVDTPVEDEDSPWAEVSASVSNIDDPEMPALTARAFVLGLFLCCVVTACNTFFYFRNPAPNIPVLVVQVIAYPLGRFLAWALPLRTFYLPSRLGGYSISLNPCPFNIKEHTIIVMMANVSTTPAYALYAIVSSELWYGKTFGVGFNILFILATQLTGLSMAGAIRRFVVWPASIIWPGLLVITTNLNTLHAESDTSQGGMSRLRYFLFVAAGAFMWYFLPGFLFTALSYFSYACWMAPENTIVNQLFGVSTGLGMGVLSFDWAQISWIGSPLTAPWWAEANVGIGFVLFYWIIVPIMYYTNTWWSAYLPISVAQIGDRFSSQYNVTYILNDDATLNTTAYAEYSPIYLSATFTMTYMIAFALTTALITHTVLHHGKRMYNAVVRVHTEKEDIHMRLMRAYPEVPDWWYIVLFGACVLLGIIAIEVFHTGMPVWGLLLSIAIAAVYIVPAAFVYAMAVLLPNINIMAELIPGYIFVGKPIQGMIFKVFTVQTLSEALTFVADMKLGHYMKVPPRSMFIVQFVACFVACFVQVGVKTWMFESVPDICSTHQKQLLTCTNAQTFFTSSVVWGLVGPGRLFGKGGIYHPEIWMLLAGALAPIPLFFYVRRWPNSRLRFLNFPIMFAGVLSIPPATGINYASWLTVGFIFQWVLRRYKFAWWSKYNYVTSAALDVGTYSCAIFIFLVISLPGASVSWWGTTVMEKTLDWDGIPYKLAGPEGFGPTTWKV